MRTARLVCAAIVVIGACSPDGPAALAGADAADSGSADSPPAADTSDGSTDQTSSDDRDDQTDDTAGDTDGTGTSDLPDTAAPDPDAAGTDAMDTDAADTAGPADTDDTTGDADTEPDEVDDSEEPDLAVDSNDDPDGSAVGEQLGVLFVGNSYIYTNDLPAVFTAVAAEAGFGPGALRVEAVTAGGYRLEQHAADYRSGAGLATLLTTAGDVAWDAVVLQEQSQIPGFPLGVPERDRSMAAVVELAGYVDTRGASTVLFQTWGYRTGDTRNSLLFPDYPTMQTRLSSGYADMATAVATAGFRVSTAPVGETYRLVWDAAAGDGTPESSPLFASLYSGDNSHPARAGTYLAACVLLAQIAGVDVRTLDTFDAGISAADRDLLQEFAMRSTAAGL